MEVQQQVRPQGAAGLAVATAAGAAVVLRHLPLAARAHAFRFLVFAPALLGAVFVAKQGPGYVRDRFEESLDEPPEFKRRRWMIRCFRHSLLPAEFRWWAQMGLLGRALRELLPLAYSSILERALRDAMPEGPMVFLHEIIYVQSIIGWVTVSAVLDPFIDGLGLRMTPDMAADLGTVQGAQLTYSIAGREFTGNVIVQEAPDLAQAMQLAQQQAAAANHELNETELARRTEAIMAERQRCVVVPVGVLRRLLQAGVSVAMN